MIWHAVSLITDVPPGVAVILLVLSTVTAVAIYRRRRGQT